MSKKALALLIALAMSCATAMPTPLIEPKKDGTSTTPALKLIERAPDPFGAPRPTPESKGVPTRTSLYVEVAIENAKAGDKISTETVEVTLRATGGKPVKVLSRGGRFEPGFSGQIKPNQTRNGPSADIYIEPAKPLEPLTAYTVEVDARSLQGVGFPRGAAKQNGWSFTTAAPAEKQSLAFNLDVAAAPVHWQGVFFSGFMKCGVCTSPFGLEPSYQMMQEDRKKNPKAWHLQRDIWLTGMDHTGQWAQDFASFNMPNLVRELQTRRIAAITAVPQGFLLKVEDFFGHEQYGIPSNRSLSEDYQAGYEILIADGHNHARAKVLASDDQARTVLVDRFTMPDGGFKIDDPAKYNRVSDPKAPGLFPLGGCYLRRFNPTGTARYYWDRLDREWDMANRYGHRLVVDFCEAPGDLSDRGKNLCPPKDYAQLHDAIRTITSHLIERYGAETCYSYTWTTFNEADIGGPTFWLGTPEEVFTYYDYCTDAVLRAFEDHGLDSNRVFIGGPEYGAIFAHLPRVEEFLRHASPRGATAASINAAMADKRLDGRRSRRTETLCRAHAGKGAPCDFISIHCYNSSKVAGDKLKLAKDMALAIDSEHYKNLWICAHEASPNWCPQGSDVAYSNVYLGNGYYPSWCADVVWRQLGQGAKDPRYAMGNSLLTTWPWPNGGSLDGANGPTLTLNVDDNGDGQSDREATLRMPIYNFQSLLGSMGDNYWILPEQKVAGHTVAGFAGRGPDGDLRVVLYAHDGADLDACAGQEFDVNLTVGGLTSGAALAEQYRFDRNHHSFFELARKIRDRPGHPVLPQEVMRKLKDKEVLRKLEAQFGKDFLASIRMPLLSASELRTLEEQVALKAEKDIPVRIGENGKVQLKATLTGNGATFLVIKNSETKAKQKNAPKQTEQPAPQPQAKPSPTPAAKVPRVTLLQKALDPFGYPRPSPNSVGVPVHTSLYFEVGLEDAKPGDQVCRPTLSVTIQAANQKPVQMLSPGGCFEKGFSGHIQTASKFSGEPSAGVYIELAQPLEPLTTYTVQVAGRSVQGATFPRGWVPQDRWSFTTAAPTRKESLAVDLDMTTRPVHWQGAFFSGLCKVGFCFSPDGLEPSYEMMARDREKYPKAWGMQRDLWLSGFEVSPQTPFWQFRLPNIVRELETRRIAKITPRTEGFLLKVEDFFGHEQYGIPSGRPLSEDYKKDYEILIADGEKHVRAKVLAVDDAAGTVLVSRYQPPEGGFKIDDPAKYDRVPNPKLPGFSPLGGCYLRRFAPLGTPRYYWGRLDAEWDIDVRRHGIRPIANFCDAPGDIAVNGRSWSPPKDFAQYHAVVRTITSHIIERYGAETALTFFWSVFNEPDLTGLYWRGTEDELHAFYDYTVDAILRAFEDHGQDPAKVFIGGLELAAPFPNLARLDEFLIHCSPRRAASPNAAFADKRLDGKRSRRVESLCRAHDGKGSPVDFVSIHIYRASAAASMLTLAKTQALAIDAEYYRNLWACSHETCPDWCPLPDLSYNEIYLGNGYYPAWCADYVWRQLSQGAKDPRYAMGNTVLSYFPWPNHGFPFGLTTAPTQIAKVDDDGDGRANRDVTLRTPIYNFLNLLASLGEDYWVLPEKTVAGHTVAGFASRGTRGELRMLLYAHAPADLQGRAGQEFEVALNVGGLAASATRATQYRFDRTHNSYFELARKIQNRPKKPAFIAPRKDRPFAEQAILSAEELRTLEEQLTLKAEDLGEVRPGNDGKARVSVKLAGNGATFIVIQNEK